MIFSSVTEDLERCKLSMLKRTLSAFIAIALLFALIWVDTLTNFPLIELALAVILVMALCEIYKPFGFLKRFIIAAIGFLLGLAVYALYPQYLSNLIPVIVLFIIVMFILAVTYHRTVSFSDISILLFTTLYISLGMLHIRLLYMTQFGLAMVFTALVAAFLTDTGA